MLCMLVAHTKFGTVEASSGQRGTLFHCPECACPVTLKRGRIVIAHFAHKPPTRCPYGVGESQLHYRCKTEIAADLRASLPADADVQLERRMPDAGLRPDVSFSIGPYDVAIEVQRSILGLDEIARRTESYRVAGVHVLWLHPSPAPADGARYAPRAWEKWLHGLYFGQVFHWSGGAAVQAVKYDPWLIHVPYSEWGYDAGEGGNGVQSAGGYDKFSKRWRTPRATGTHFIGRMRASSRAAFQSVPAALLWSV